MREVKVPVTTLLAVIGGSDSDIDETIASLLGREVTESELEAYLGNHFATEERREVSRAIVNGWRQEFCHIPTRVGYEFVGSLVTMGGSGLEKRRARFVARSEGDARAQAAAHFEVPVGSSLLFVERKTERTEAA